MNPRRHPIRNLTTLLKKHDAVSRENISRITAFYLKLILQEPFRILENINHKDKIRTHNLREDPVFIIGHWRSGTSFLQYLLGKDPQFGYMNKFGVVFPDVFLQSESFLKSWVQRIPETLNIIRDAQNMSIDLDLNSPSEIEIALTTMISPTSLHWGHIFPKDGEEYFNKYLFFETANSKEIAQWKRDYHHLIKKTSLKNDGRQLLIKSPGNTSRIKKLLEMYPDAKFIFIHRNPYDVFYSNKKLWRTLLNNLSLQNFTHHQMEQAIIRNYKKLMSSYLEQRQLIPPRQLVELRFDDVMSYPTEQLYSVYEHLQLDGFAEAEPHFQKFLQQQSGSRSTYEYTDRIISLINKNWGFTFDQWNYPIRKAPVPAE